MKHIAIAFLLPALACSAQAAEKASSSGRIYFLDLKGGRVLSALDDGTNVTVLVEGRKTPDGVVIDTAAKHLYWTNMGRVKDDDGSIERVDLDGKNLTAIVPVGGTFTPKQLKLEEKSGKLYWSDREGMRVMRANKDGSRIETLVETGSSDADRQDPRNWCVGIAVDAVRGKIYWTQKGGNNAGTGSIRRANLEIPAGQTAATRTDIEILFDRLPEPIDLDLDLTTRMIYWTDRGDPPNGNTVNRAPMDPPVKFDPAKRADLQILVRELKEAIGIALDLPGGRMFFTDLGGSVYVARLDGSGSRAILTGMGSLTGIAYTGMAKQAP